MKTQLIYLALILLSLAACKKDKSINGPGSQPQQLPPITTEGKNTFGCLVNGEVWVPEVKPWQMFIYPLASSYELGQLQIVATRRIKDAQGNFVFYDLIVIGVTCNSTGIYTINKSYNTVVRFSNILNGCIYETDSIDVGEVNIIKYDTSNFIISGTFNFNLVTTGCDTIKVTQGRFDVKYAN